MTLYTMDADVSHFDIKNNASDEWTEVSGVASVEIPDAMGDIVSAGAFMPVDPSIVKMFLHHKHDQPVGVWTEIAQRGSQLLVKGKILQTLEKGREAIALLRNRIISGLSVGFRCAEDGQKRDAKGRRVITRAKLFEVSFVSIPACLGAAVTHVLHDTSPMTLKLDALDDGWRKSSRRLGAVLDDMAVMAGSLVEQSALSGTVPMDQAQILIKSLTQNLRRSAR